MDTMIFDNIGGANSVTASGMLVTMYWTPPPVSVPRWNDASTGLFQAKYAANKDPRLRFRVLDVDLVAASQSNIKGGTLCMQTLSIDAADISMCRVLKNLYTANTMIQATATPGVGNVEAFPLNPENMLVVFAGGAVTFTGVDHWNGFPPAPGGELAHNGRLLEIAEVRPATDTTYGEGPPWTSYADNWPIPWVSGQLLRLQVGISCPNDTISSVHPWDAIFLSWQAMTNEINVDSFVTTNQGIATPQPGTPQTYTAFLYTLKQTVAADARFRNLKWHVRFINHPSVFFPSGNQTIDGVNIGAITCNSVKVDQVTFSD
jgi:hypothetical protein